MTRQTLIATLALTLVGSNSFAAPSPAAFRAAPSVTMTLAEYNRLLDLGGRAPAVPAAPPIAAVVSSADLKITVDRDIARGTFSLSGQVLASGVNRVPLVSGATLVDVTSGGRPVPLITEGQALHALIAGPGAVRDRRSNGAGRCRIGQAGRRSCCRFHKPAPRGPPSKCRANRLTFACQQGSITRRLVANGRTTIDATLDPGAATEVWWSMRDAAPVAAAKDLRALAEIMTLITLDDSDVRMVALVDINVTQGELRTDDGAVCPPAMSFNRSAAARSKNSAPLASELILTVGNSEARSHQFLVTLERPHQGGSFTLDTGVISLKDIQRERGEIAIEGVGTMDLRGRRKAGLASHRRAGAEPIAAIARAPADPLRVPLSAPVRDIRATACPRRETFRRCQRPRRRGRSRHRHDTGHGRRPCAHRSAARHA